MSSGTYWVVGAGSVGVITAARLRTRPPCRLIDEWAEHIEAIRADGLQIDYSDARLRLRLPAHHLDDIAELDESPDVVLVAVKSTATESTVTRLVPFLKSTTLVVSLQNGMNEATISRLIGAERTIGAVVAYGGEIVAPGHARTPRTFNGNGGQLILGQLDGSHTTRLQRLANNLRHSIPVKLTDNIGGYLWSKLIVNVQVNALCALVGEASEVVARDPSLRRLSISMACEAVDVAVRLGHVLDSALVWGASDLPLEICDDLTWRRVEGMFVERWKAGAKPSMLQDIEARRPTEIDAINGHVVAAGYKLGVDVRVNESIVNLVKRLEAGDTDRSQAQKALVALAAQTKSTLGCLRN